MGRLWPIAPSCTIQPSIQLRWTRPALAQLCRYVPSFEEIPFHNAPLRESATERSGAHNCHAHPSGDPNPSRADELVTQRLKEALALVDIRLLDHLIVGDTVSSMAELGLM
jgi:hypothetical protein